jgi:hypothetical protein
MVSESRSVQHVMRKMMPIEVHSQTDQRLMRGWDGGKQVAISKMHARVTHTHALMGKMPTRVHCAKNSGFVPVVGSKPLCAGSVLSLESSGRAKPARLLAHQEQTANTLPRQTLVTDTIRSRV